MFTVFPPNSEIPKNGRIKFGIDPTAPNLHLGHFVPLRLVKKFQDQGHPIDIILGTFTAQLGDPSGRDKTRPILTPEETENNASVIRKQLDKILSPGFTIFKNGVFAEQMTVPSLFSILTKFNLNELTSRDAFQERIQKGNPIGMHELLVPILQGLDSLMRTSAIEIGGTDQLFNFQVSRKVQEINGQKPEICLMTPIIVGTDGRKMSKSLGNCIFLNESPEDIFGKCMSISDAVMEEWIPLLTDNAPESLSPMNRKKWMAESIVSQICGVEDAANAKNNFEKTVQNKELPNEIASIKAGTLIDSICVIRNCSKSEARRLLKAGSVQVDNEKQNEDCAVLNGQLIKVGKRDFARIV
jgi:tyrosyl-tRNA synthetase